MENKEIAGVFKKLSRLMELHGENEFKVRSLQNASFRIERNPVPLKNLSPEELASLEGIGKGTSQKITALLQDGTLPELTDLQSRTPSGVIEMMEIKGLGPKKVKVIWQELGIQSPGELLYACNENRLVELKGFGAKTQEQILKSIEFLIKNTGWFHFAEAEAMANAELEFLRGLFPESVFEITGPLRRACEVIDCIELLTDVTETDLQHHLKGQRDYHPEKKHYSLESGIAVRFHFTDPENTFAFDLFESTGHPDHVSRIQTLVSASGVKISSLKSEQEIYRSAGCHFIPPECREGSSEFDFSGNYNDLITLPDLKGCLHNHSTWSDGMHSIREMAQACIGLQLQYFGICDHSRSAFYANGLTAERVAAQHAEIDRLNAELAPFRILKGIESDILPDGSLDYPDEVLASFDLVVASVHSGLNMDRTKATDRLLKAIANPYTTILGHPTGRLLLAREGYPVDMEAVIDACAAHQVVIELNAHPYRLDLDWRWIRKATDKGVLISINPDAHRMDGIGDMYYGVCAARKGFLLKHQTFNTLDLESMLQYLTGKRNKTAVRN